MPRVEQGDGGDHPLPHALTGLRVLEIGGEIAAGYATLLLTRLGADVVKLEPPGGDALRAWGPFPGDVPDRETGGLFRALNTNKRSVVLDVGDRAAFDDVRRLVAAADVVVESLGPGVLERAGLDAERLRDGNDTLALVRISDFGQTGPSRDVPTTELTLQTMAGWVSAHGVPGRAPVKVGGRLAELTVASYAASAALTAARVARARRELVVVDLSAFECLVGTLPYPMLFDASLRALGLPPPDQRHSTLPGIVRCRDGWVGINCLTGQHWQDVCAMVGADEFAGRQTELGWGGPELERFYATLQPWLDERTVEEIVELSQAFRIPAAPVADGRSLLENAQFRSRPFFVDEPGSSLVLPGPPWRLARTPASLRSAAPRLGSDDAARVWPLSPDVRDVDVDPARASDALPFEGLRVVDLGTFWAGPYASLYLGALGADVIKVESVQRPDGFRFSGAFPQEGDDYYDRSGIWQATNLNKRDVTLDLTRPAGRELLEHLLVDADVVVENFSARVVEQFGLGYEELRKLRDDVIMVRMPGFGLAGPWRDYVGWAMGIEQAAGMCAVTGRPDRPMNPGGFLDPVIGMHAAVAIQAALAHRDRTGDGQMIEIAQLEVGVNLTAEQVVDWVMNGRVAHRDANRDRRCAPQGVYPCASEHGAPGASPSDWVAISVRDDEDWAQLVRALGGPEWVSDPALKTHDGRHDRHDELDDRLAEWTSTRAADDVVGALRPHGVPVARPSRASELYDEPQLVARRYYQDLDNVKTGTRRYPGWPMRFSFLERPHRFGPPTLGQHNDEILGGELGVDDARRAQLAADGVIGDRLAI